MVLIAPHPWGSAPPSYTPGSILPPAPQAKSVNIHFAQKIWVIEKPYGRATVMVSQSCWFDLVNSPAHTLILTFCTKSLTLRLSYVQRIYRKENKERNSCRYCEVYRVSDAIFSARPGRIGNRPKRLAFMDPMAALREEWVISSPTAPANEDRCNLAPEL
jgi:hypothetical protein